jgi:endoglucanase
MKFCILIFILSFISCGEASSAQSYVKKHGRLSIEGSSLVDQYGEKIQLKGMSSHGLQWFGNYANYNSMKELRDKWNQNVFRAAMYTAEGGYLSNPSLKNKVHEIVRAAEELGIYVIIDWHILSDRNPLWNKEKAKAFFAEMAKTYSGISNVMYEICNEPNGGDVNWWNAIKPYAKEVIPVIRQYDPEGIIIVGTGTWSQDVHHPAKDPIMEDNIMYAAHFYAGSHGQFLRDRIAKAMDSEIAIFVTEFGAMGSSGNGSLNYGEIDRWMKFMEERKISWTAWSLSNSNHSHSVLKTWANSAGQWSDKDLSEHGKLIRRYMN